MAIIKGRGFKKEPVSSQSLSSYHAPLCTSPECSVENVKFIIMTTWFQLNESYHNQKNFHMLDASWQTPRTRQVMKKPGGLLAPSPTCKKERKSWFSSLNRWCSFIFTNSHPPTLGYLNGRGWWRSFVQCESSTIASRTSALMAASQVARETSPQTFLFSSLSDSAGVGGPGAPRVRPLPGLFIFASGAHAKDLRDISSALLRGSRYGKLTFVCASGMSSATSFSTSSLPPLPLWVVMPSFVLALESVGSRKADESGIGHLRSP